MLGIVANAVAIFAGTLAPFPRTAKAVKVLTLQTMHLSMIGSLLMKRPLHTLEVMLELQVLLPLLLQLLLVSSLLLTITLGEKGIECDVEGRGHFNFWVCAFWLCYRGSPFNSLEIPGNSFSQF